MGLPGRDQIPSQLMVGSCLQQSPFPAWGHMLHSGLDHVPSQVSLSGSGTRAPCATGQRNSETPDPGVPTREGPRHPSGRQALTLRNPGYCLCREECRGWKLPADPRCKRKAHKMGIFCALNCILSKELTYLHSIIRPFP